MKVWVRRFVRLFQVLRNRLRGMSDKFGCARRGHNFIRGAGDFIRELARQENRCLGNPEIRRPFLGFIYAVHQRVVFVRRESRVEGSAKLRIHNNDSDKGYSPFVCSITLLICSGPRTAVAPLSATTITRLARGVMKA